VRLKCFCVCLCTWITLNGWAQESPPQEPEYTGPAILSRGGAPRLGYGEEMIQLRPFARVAGIYDTGLTGLFTDERGALPQQDAYGVMASGGVLGYHSWRHTVLGVSYEAVARHYTRRTYYDGVDQVLGLALSHQASRRVRIELNESAASRRGGFYGLIGSSLYNQEFTQTTEDQLFDARIHVMASTARVIFQKSQRLSYSAAGSFLAAQPHSQALVKVRSASTTGDVAYRVSRRQTVGASYQFGYFWFPGAFGEAYFHGTRFQYAAQLTRRWTLSLGAGGYRVETSRLATVRIDPVIAAIIGQHVGIEVFHRIIYIPAIEAMLNRQFRHASFSASYSRGVSAGNGIYLTSARESAGVSLGYSGIRRWHFSASAGYSRLGSLAQTLGRYRNLHAGAGMTYRVSGPVSLFARVDGRQYRLAGPGFERIHYRATLGLAFSPGDIPLSLW